MELLLDFSLTVVCPGRGASNCHVLQNANRYLLLLFVLQGGYPGTSQLTTAAFARLYSYNSLHTVA